MRSYLAIPQANHTVQLQAINTIATYAALAKQFVVVAPHTVHINKGTVCDAASYLRRGWCRVEQWAAMVASESTDHMLIYEGGELAPLGSRDEWISTSLEVFGGEFSYEGDKQKLVGMLLGLYAYCISNGKDEQPRSPGRLMASAPMLLRGLTQLRGSGKGSGVRESRPKRQRGSTTLERKLIARIEANKARIFPPEWFSEVETLESEIESLMSGKDARLFSQAEFKEVLRSKRALLQLHGTIASPQLHALLPHDVSLPTVKERRMKLIGDTAFKMLVIEKTRASTESSSTPDACDAAYRDSWI